MALFKILLFCVFVAIAKGCQLNAQEAQMMGMQCAAKSPELFLQMAGMNMQKDNDDKVFNIFCNHKQAVVDIALCMMDKMEDCFPEAKPVMKLIGSKERWLSAMKLICDNKETLMDTCMDDNIGSFMTCYMGKVTTLAKSGLNGKPKEIVCRVIHSEENCLVENKGSCSDKYVQVLKDFLETIFPVEHCTEPAVIKNHGDLANSLFGSILVHGQPQGLKFKSYGKPYVIKN